MAKLWPPVVIGVAAFFVAVGGAALLPGNVAWAMIGDSAANWLSWEFFRRAPLLQWPLGKNSSYGLEIGSSIVFGDAVPLFAFILKPLLRGVSTPFQYLGGWLFSCFVLQAVFAWKLLGLVTEHRVSRGLGTVFFVISPPALFRIPEHSALVGHWLILAGLYLYFRARFSWKHWFLLLAVVVLVHAYLALMVMALFAADLLQRLWQRELKLVSSVLGFLLVGLGTVSIMWAAGYFALGLAPAESGYAFYRMNLLSLINPMGNWSRVLPSYAQTAGDYEGFNYLGIGIIGLAPVALVLVMRRPSMPKLRTLLPLLLVCAVLTLFAVSNRIVLGTTELLSIPMPSFLVPFTNAFRTGGRMFWPAFYSIYFALFSVVFRPPHRRWLTVTCAALVVAQCVDMHKPMLSRRARYTQEHQSPLHSPLWNELGARARRLLYVMPANAPKHWAVLARFAVFHGMDTNFGYLSRVDPITLNVVADQLKNDLETLAWDEDALYVFVDSPLWQVAVARRRPSDVVASIDGFNVLAPGQAHSLSLTSLGSTLFPPIAFKGYRLRHYLTANRHHTRPRAGRTRKHGAVGRAVRSRRLSSRSRRTRRQSLSWWQLLGRWLGRAISSRQSQ